MLMTKLSRRASLDTNTLYNAASLDTIQSPGDSVEKRQIPLALFNQLQFRRVHFAHAYD